MSDLRFGPNSMWEHRIRQRAYELYEARQRDRISATDWQDWLGAESEVFDEIRGSQLHEARTPETHKLAAEQNDELESKLQTCGGLRVVDVEQMVQAHYVKDVRSI